ncbi:winged helix-turn-helix domain-containing protein [Streptomyces sp. NPDC048182]|uniref:winged helix-turn-helix domain-containing protein n=1 Tax=Streptomyces sp. NPDC048182 TaxID=3365507 RepID=UPI00372240E6
MTTALPAPTASPLPDPRRLRLVGDPSPDRAADEGPAPLVGYLVLVPEGTDPAELFAKDRPLPEIRPLAPPASAASPAPPAAPRTRDDVVRIDPALHSAEVDGRELDLTYLEFELLAHLVRNPHRVHSREQLVGAVWGYDHVGDGRTVDVHVARLRRKLGAAHRQRIVTVRRLGYKYTPDRAAPERRTSPDAARRPRP